MKHLQTLPPDRSGRPRRLDAPRRRGHEHHRLGAEPAHQPLRGGVRRRAVRAAAGRRAAQPGRRTACSTTTARTLSDLSRVQSQVADLTGERRGHVSIACSQALLPYFLPRQIARYRAEHPGRDLLGQRARPQPRPSRNWRAYSSDLALVFEPVYLVDFEVMRRHPAGGQRGHALRPSAGRKAELGCATASTRRTSRPRSSTACATCSISPPGAAHAASRRSSRRRASS